MFCTANLQGLWLLLGAGAAGGAYYYSQQGQFNPGSLPVIGVSILFPSSIQVHLSAYCSLTNRQLGFRHFLQGAQTKPDYKAVREAISDILEAENYDDGELEFLLWSLITSISS